MSNYSFSNTLDGLNNIESNDINTDNISADYITVNINSSVPLVTPYTTNSNQIASCAFVQDAFTNNLSNYVTLNTTQTISGDKTFSNTNGVKFNKGLIQNDIIGGSNSSSMYQAGINCNIVNNYNNGCIRLTTKDSSGNVRDGVYALNGNRAGIQGDNNNTIEILGTQATIGGTSVPKITTQPLTASNTNEIASTAFVKTNLLDYVTLGTAQTITANKTFNGTTTLNNFFVSNYVDLTLTTYENQFYGDIYGYRGVVCQNGFYVKDSPGAGATTYALIDASGNITTTSNISAQSITLPNRSINDLYLSTNIPLKNGTNLMTGTTNFLTQTNTCVTRPTGTNDTTLANTAFVKNQGYAKLDIIFPLTQTFTGAQNFPTPATSDNSTLAATTAYVKNQGYATTSSLTDYVTLASDQTITANKTFNGNTYFNATSSFKTDIRCNDVGGGAFATQIYQSGVGLNFVPIHSSAIISLYTRTSGGATVENIRCQNGTQNLIRGSINMMNDGIVFNDIGLGPNSTSIYQTGPTCTITNNFNNGNIRLNTRDSSGNSQDGVYAINGNRAGLQGNANKTIEVNGNDCTINCDNFKSNAPFECTYNTLGTVPTKTNYDIGYIWQITGSALPNWTTFTTIPQNIATMVFNGTGDYTKGVWQVNIVLCTECINPPNSRLIWTTVSNSSDLLTKYCTYENGATAFGLLIVQIMRLSFILNVTTTPSTYYLNYVRTNGVGSSLVENKTNSHIEFTRIA